MHLYTPEKSWHTLGGLLKLNGLRGGERTSAVTLPAGVAVGQCFFRKTSGLYTFNIVFYNMALCVLFCFHLSCFIFVL